MSTLPMISEITGQVPEERTDKAFDRSAALVGVALDGRYRVTELVGAGETSCLYNGFDRFRNIPVAIKVLHRHLVTRAGFIDRFDDEASSPGHVGLISQRYSYYRAARSLYRSALRRYGTNNRLVICELSFT